MRSTLWRFYSVAICLFFGAAFCSAQSVSYQNSLLQLRTLDDHAPFVMPASVEAWNVRKTQLKEQLLVSLGLSPAPKLAPLQPRVFGAIERDGFIVHKVIVETLPGFYLTGSLFVPSGDLSGRSLPAVLNPHGHWPDGRMYRCTDQELKELLATGAERFESAARNHIQARCVQLARMGCVAFAYDMIGYADSQQISLERAHGYGNNSVNPSSPESRYLFFSPQAEMYQQNIMGLQAIHSLRAIEFVQSLPYVDGSRLAITGASGGGTQSFITAALDNRIVGAFPAVMVSTGMQGGCTCENAAHLRTNTGNVELAALIAPRPLGLTAADDWTKDFESDGYPELKTLYSMLGGGDRLELHSSTHFPHNFNHVNRVAMYGFMNRLFKLGLQEPILEKDFAYLTRDELSVWTSENERPPSGLDLERQLLEAWQAQIDAYFELPDPTQADAFLRTERGKQLAQGWNVLTSFAEPWTEQCQVLYSWPLDQPQPCVVIKNAAGVPIADGKLFGKAALIQRGKGATVNVDWSKIPEVHLRLNGKSQSPSTASQEGLVIDLHVNDPLMHESTAEMTQMLVSNPRPAAAFTYGYNAPAIIRRLGVVLSLIDQIHSLNQATKVDISAAGSDQFIAAASAWRRSATIRKLHFDSQDSFRFGKVDSIRHLDFLPGALRYQDMPGLLICVGGNRQVHYPE